VDVPHESDSDNDVGQVLSDNEFNYDEESSNSIEKSSGAIRDQVRLDKLYCNMCRIQTFYIYKVLAETSQTDIVVSASVKEDESGGQGHTSESLLHQSAA
jgi:hypothetical protein